MEQEQANQLALTIVQQLLDAATDLECEVAGKAVAVTVERKQEPPPAKLPAGVQASDWPEQLALRCTWPGGAVTFECLALATPKRDVALVCRLANQRARMLSHTNLTSALTASEEPEVPVLNWFFIKKGGFDALNRELRRMMAKSGMPLGSDTSVELFRIQVEDGHSLPDAPTAYERFVKTNLLKLDFFSHGPRAKDRGTPLVDVSGFAQIDAATLGDATDEPDPRAYWAGGYGDTSRLERFLAGDYWEVGWKRDEDTRGARMSWANLAKVQPGDWFAIKGLSNKLYIRHLAEVASVDLDAGRIQLRPLPLHGPLYEGPAPTGRGAGNWWDTLLPLTRDDAIALVFGAALSEAPERTEPAAPPALPGPRNRIYFGPPGTGKTFKIRSEIVPRFESAMGRSDARDEYSLEDIDNLSWFEAVASALVACGGEADAMTLRAHPIVTAKFAARGLRANIGARIWATLQTHTVQDSETVKYGKRTGQLVFDKRDDGTWFFPDGVPENIAEIARSLAPDGPQGAREPNAYTFLTFHQSYAYEDFVEGIRPYVADDDEAAVSYRMEDGVFHRAATAALRLTGFKGSIEHACQLEPSERRELFEDAPLYAVIIDEINRGNVSRVFGELITLLEEDKRLGADHEIIATLPYSRRLFGVPPNLCVIGTMNTADRSVEALDTALRRRFAFYECPPDPKQLEGTRVGGAVDVSRMLRTINERIELLLDRDHRIGHAHFMPLNDDPRLDLLQDIFARHVLPLLQEYFYSDLGRIGLVLGSAFVRTADHSGVLAQFDHDALDSLSERVVYRLTPADELTSEAFRSIYEGALASSPPQ